MATYRTHRISQSVGFLPFPGSLTKSLQVITIRGCHYFSSLHSLFTADIYLNVSWAHSAYVWVRGEFS